MEQSARSTLTVRRAGELLRTGQVSSVELTQMALDRIRDVEPRTKAFVTVTEDLALEQAREADERIAARMRAR